MAEQTITASDVTPVASSTTSPIYIAGEAIDAGEVVYADATDTVNGRGKAKLAQCDGTEAQAQAIGFALNSAASGQPVVVHSTGLLNVTSAAVGQIYVLGTTPGKVMLESDLASTNYVTILATGATSTRYDVDINATAIQHA